MSKLESKTANRLLLYALLLAASYTLMRTVGDSLFLSRIGSDSLATVFLASGISTAIVASLWFGLTRRLSLEASIRASAVAFAGLTLAAWAALPVLHDSWWLLAAIYLLTEIKGCVNAINVVTAMNELLGGHSSRHAWARIGLGGPLAFVVIGTLIGLEASFIDLRTWLLVSALLDLTSLLPLMNASRLKVPHAPAANVSENSFLSTVVKAADKFGTYACSRKFRFWIGTLIGAKVVVLTLVTFFWKVSVSQYFSGNEQSLTRYFGVFYACIGLLTLLIQGLVTGRLISRRNLHVPILVMPATLSILAAIVAFSASALFLVIIATLAKSMEIWRRSVHDTTLNLLYTNIHRKNRRAAIAVNNGVVKPLAEVGASLVLLFGTAMWHKSAFVLALGIWVIATIALLRLLTQRKSTRGPMRDSALQAADAGESNIKQLVPSLFNH